MVQLALFINDQNGSVLDAVKLWKRNVDKTFEGVEECTICYAVVHGSNYQLPKMVRTGCSLYALNRDLCNVFRVDSAVGHASTSSMRIVS